MFSELFERRFRFFVLALALILLFFFSQYFFAEKKVVKEPLLSPSPNLSKSSFPLILSSSQEVVLPDSRINFERKTFSNGSDFREEVSLTNLGNSSAAFSLFELVPPALGSVSDSSFSSPDALRTRVLSDFPLVRYSEYVVSPGRSVKEVFSSRRGSENILPRFFVSPFLSESQVIELNSTLSRLSSIELSLNESLSAENFINNLLNKGGKNFSEKLSKINSYIDFLSEVKKKECSFDWQCGKGKKCVYNSCKNTSIDLPEPSPTVSLGSSLFPSVPDVLEFFLSEESPSGVNYFVLESSLPLGEPLLKISGELSELSSEGVISSFKVKRISENSFNISVLVDVENVDFVEGLLPFDELKGFLVVSYAALLQEKSIPIVVKINHVNLWPTFYSDEEDPDSYDDFEITDPSLPVVSPKPSYEYSVCRTESSRIVSFAQSFVGKIKYVWGGTSLSRGADCSGFVQSVFKNFGIYLPRTSREQFNVGVPVSKNSLYTGDLVFFKNTGRSGISHVGIYLGYGKYGKCTFLHSSSGSKTVSYGSICNSFFRQRYAGAKRVIKSCVSAIDASPKTSSSSGGGIVVAINAGHGYVERGCNEGAVGESEANQDIALRLKQLIEAGGGKVVLTRVTDCKNGVEANLRERAEKANSAGASIAIDIHHDSYFGTKVYAYSDSGACSSYHSECDISLAKDANSARLAKLIYSKIQPVVGDSSGNRVKGYNLYFLRYARMPAVTIEVTNIEKNPVAKTPEFRQKVAQAIYEGILSYFQRSSLGASGYRVSEGNWHKYIYTTVFNDKGSGLYAALPDADAKGKNIEVRNPKNGKTIVVPVLDVGPWCTQDEDYVFKFSKPFAEINCGRNLASISGNPSCPPRGRTNCAGLDLSPAAMAALGVSGNARLDWRFVS